jgi:Leucine-rich repeat (LRR) protein
MNPHIKRRKVLSGKVTSESNIDILKFPDEIILQILSFLTISECFIVREITTSGTILAKLIDASIYGRVIVYRNQTSRSFLKSRHYKKPYEVVDQGKLYGLITNRNFIYERIKPHRFVLSFTANPHNRNLEEEESFLNEFESAFRQHSDYFRQATKFELYMDLGNKDHEIGTEKQEVRFLQRLLDSEDLSHNLSTLNIVKGQNYVDRERNEISDLLNSTLSTFKSLETVFLSTNNLQNINSLKYPDCLRSLDLIYNMIVQLPTNRLWLPSNLKYINLSCNEIVSLEGVEFPDTIEYMDIQLNTITSLSNINFPRNLKTLIACGNEITIEENIIIDLPSCLEILNLLQNPFENDLSIFNIPDSLRRIYFDARLKEVNSIHKNNHLVVYY